MCRRQAERSAVTVRGGLLVAGSALLCALLAGALVTTYTVMNNRVARVERELRETQRELDVTSAQVKEANRAKVLELSTRLDETSGTLATFVDGAKKQAAQLKLLNDCLPELENQLSNLGLQTTAFNGYLTGVSITNPAQITPHCSNAIYGGSGLGGDVNPR